jgi:hypothetical protein
MTTYTTLKDQPKRWGHITVEGSQEDDGTEVASIEASIDHAGIQMVLAKDYNSFGEAECVAEDLERATDLFINAIEEFM